jgi:hypothetical protein
MTAATWRHKKDHESHRIRARCPQNKRQRRYRDISSLGNNQCLWKTRELSRYTEHSVREDGPRMESELWTRAELTRGSDPYTPSGVSLTASCRHFSIYWAGQLVCNSTSMRQFWQMTLLINVVRIMSTVQHSAYWLIAKLQQWFFLQFPPFHRKSKAYRYTKLFGKMVNSVKLSH